MVSTELQAQIDEQIARRREMSVVEFIEDVEKSHFRTNGDIGANSNALFVWNLLREYAGLPRLSHDDLSQRHADERGISLDEQKRDEWLMDRARYHRGGGLVWEEAFHQAEVDWAERD